MLSANQIAERLQFGYETRGLELKGPGSREDSHLLAKVARAALSLGNLRDGGYLIIGIADGDPSKLEPGLNEEDLESWVTYDALGMMRQLGLLPAPASPAR